jgi:hypothetical protein
VHRIPLNVARAIRHPFERVGETIWLSRLPAVKPIAIAPGYRIAVMGNGPVQDIGSELINSHDLVVRFNTCGSYRGGERTDIIVLISGGVHGRHFARNRGHVPPECLAQAREFWLTPKPGMRSYTEEIVRRRIGRRPWRYISDEDQRHALRMLRTNGAGESYRPSSGLLALCHIRAAFPSARVTLFGFSHEGTGNHAWNVERTIIDNWFDWIARA